MKIDTTPTSPLPPWADDQASHWERIRAEVLAEGEQEHVAEITADHCAGVHTMPSLYTRQEWADYHDFVRRSKERGAQHETGEEIT
jgi:hypothetical protein